MSYQVLARKWRPQRFADVLGQAHITQTLQNALCKGRVGHAYLFVGPRGIGKTTSARIFAKALNCEQPERREDGIYEPCCACRSCQEIAEGSCLDVLEIDGASHNGVEHIRDLRENVQYTPTHGRTYKVYIIDEVHMLSTPAWNALLKTLEEPPPHVKFLFATTEAHKVLPTILSRCQRFDLKRIPVPLIVRRLRDIAAAEGIFIADGALTVIARAAEGGMRDAQSILDQMIAFCGGDTEAARIEESDVIDVFGLASQAELEQLAGSMLADDASALVLALHHLADRGRDLERLYTDLLLFLRTIMVTQVVAEPGLVLSASEEELTQLSELSAGASPAVVQALVEGLMSADGGIRNTLNKRVFVETTLLRVMRDAHAVKIDELIARLRALQAGQDPGPEKPEATAKPRPSAAPSPLRPQPPATQPPRTPGAAVEPATAARPRASVAPPAAAPEKRAGTPRPEPEQPAAPPEAAANDAASPNQPSSPSSQKPRTASSKTWKELENNDFVSGVCDLFGGKIVDVRD